MDPKNTGYICLNLNFSSPLMAPQPSVPHRPQPSRPLLVLRSASFLPTVAAGDHVRVGLLQEPRSLHTRARSLSSPVRGRRVLPAALSQSLLTEWAPGSSTQAPEPGLLQTQDLHRHLPAQVFLFPQPGFW